MNHRQMQLVNQIPSIVESQKDMPKIFAEQDKISGDIEHLSSEITELRKLVLELQEVINALNGRINAPKKRGRPRKVDALRQPDKVDMRSGTL